MHNRRDFIKWVLYLGAVAQLPVLASPEEFPHDVLEGISLVNKKIIDIVRASGRNIADYRAREDAAFERVMQEMWRTENGDAPYARVVGDRGLQPARRWQYEGHWYDEPESYVTTFQYRRTK